MLNKLNIYPKLTISERNRVHNIDSLTCPYMDFLLFFDYLIAPKAFKQFIIKNTFVDEVHLLVTMKRLNLYAVVDQRKFNFISDPLLNNYEYNTVLVAYILYIMYYV